MKITLLLLVFLFSFTNRSAAVIAEKKTSFSTNVLQENRLREDANNNLPVLVRKFPERMGRFNFAPSLIPQKISEKDLATSTIFTKNFLLRLGVELIASFVLIASLLFIPNIYSPATVVLTLIGAIFLLGYSFYEIAKIIKDKEFRSIPSFLLHLLIALLGIFTFKKYK
jgi:VIT1/CCC1 family predicted Fe2+/Mn2+ transporter